MMQFTPSYSHSAEGSPLLVYYSNTAKIDSFNPFSLLVLDSHYHPPLRPLEDRGKTLLGYISLGEVENIRPYFKKVKDDGIVLFENKNWQGSYFIDVRDKRWTKRVIEELIPDILRKGFHGLFLDTLDNPPHLERINPKKYADMTQAAINLVLAIRYHYPDIIIMMNRGYELLPDVGGDLDMVLGEAVYTRFDFTTKQYVYVAKKEYQIQVTMLKAAQKSFPKLKIYTLDYWNPKDSKGVADIYAQQYKNGFLPYVSTLALDEIISPP
ncbi:MAG: endo alpha-1,4 polygalactosaminidase [Magnetococcales bacterium]|nr:endo alpha-1,4 polygalactosaminidase [Magnetococcales bacterium]